MIPHNIPTLDKEEETAALRVLRSHWIAEGKEVEQFEDELCRFLGVPRGSAVALSSGSAALYVALQALGVGKGDEVIVPSYACSALLDAVFLAQAKPRLVDVNEQDLNLSLAETKRGIGRKTKAIIVTHTNGMPADMKAILRLGVPVIEDCAQAIGAMYDGKPVGVFGDIAVFSFGATKMLTSGHGGMVCSRKKALVKRARSFREYEEQGPYRQRFNFQMSDFQAAVGRAQLSKLPGFLARRKQTAEHYYKAFSAERCWPPRLRGRKPNFYRFLLKTENPELLRRRFEKAGVETRVCIRSLTPLHRRLGLEAKRFPITEWSLGHTLSLPIHPSLREHDISRIIKVGRQFISS